MFPANNNAPRKFQRCTRHSQLSQQPHIQWCGFFGCAFWKLACQHGLHFIVLRHCTVIRLDTDLVPNGPLHANNELRELHFGARCTLTTIANFLHNFALFLRWDATVVWGRCLKRLIMLCLFNFRIVVYFWLMTLWLIKAIKFYISIKTYGNI